MARLLKANLGYSVARIFVSSSYPPHRRFPLWWYHLAPTPLVWFFLRFLAGLPKEYRSKQFLNNYQVLAATQRDLHAMDWYNCRADRYLDCPIHMINGDQDKMTPHTEVVVGWADFTTAEMHVKLLHGSGHLFVLEKETAPALLEYLGDALAASPSPAPLQQRLPSSSSLARVGSAMALSHAVSSAAATAKAAGAGSAGGSSSGGPTPPREALVSRASSASSEP
jgi:surfactin synthase thioesterase subunit